MRKNGNPLSPSPKAAPALQAALWIVAIGGPSWFLYNNGVQSARSEAEERVLSEVAQQIQSPSSSRRDVFAVLTQHEEEISEARYLRACSRLGIKPSAKLGWNSLFAAVLRRGKEEQDKSARVIAEVCGLSPVTSLKQERVLLTVKLVAAKEVEVFLPAALQPMAPGRAVIPLQAHSMPD